MNAAVVNSFENPPHFGAFEDPVAETKEQLVSVRAAALSTLFKAQASGRPATAAGVQHPRSGSRFSTMTVIVGPTWPADLAADARACAIDVAASQRNVDVPLPADRRPPSAGRRIGSAASPGLQPRAGSPPTAPTGTPTCWPPAVSTSGFRARFARMPISRCGSSRAAGGSCTARGASRIRFVTLRRT